MPATMTKPKAPGLIIDVISRPDAPSFLTGDGPPPVGGPSGIRSKTLRFDLPAVRQELLKRNQALPKPLPICPACRLPALPTDMDDLFTRLCSTCGCNAVYDLVNAIVARWGRRAGLAKLKALAAK